MFWYVITLFLECFSAVWDLGSIFVDIDTYTNMNMGYDICEKNEDTKIREKKINISIYSSIVNNFFKYPR